MAENTKSPEAIQPQAEKTSRIKDFTIKHPRAAKVVGITAAAATVVGVVAIVKNRKHDDNSTEAGALENSSETSTTETPKVTEA